MEKKTSLERSHSKVSNFKLTMITFLASLSFCGVFVGLGLLDVYKTISIIILAASGVILLFSLMLIRRFVR